MLSTCVCVRCGGVGGVQDIGMFFFVFFLFCFFNKNRYDYVCLCTWGKTIGTVNGDTSVVDKCLFYDFVFFCCWTLLCWGHILICLHQIVCFSNRYQPHFSLPHSGVCHPPHSLRHMHKNTMDVCRYLAWPTVAKQERASMSSHLYDLPKHKTYDVDFTGHPLLSLWKVQV